MKFEPINRFIVVDRDFFVLELYKRPDDEWKFFKARSYDIAIGQLGYVTPRGMYLINSRAKCPEWKVPNSDWAIEAGLTPGDIYEGCTPENPLKARWLGITNPIAGIGIHGTDQEDSIGTRASHGCVRMLVADVIKLYEDVPLYTPIYIV